MVKNFNMISEVERNSDDYWKYLSNIAEKELLLNEDIDNETMGTVINEEERPCL